MKQLRIIIIVLLILIQYPLWLGKGSWLSVWDLHKKIVAQEKRNLSLHQKNQKLQADLDDLEHGYDAVEEHARNELYMIKQDEVFIQYPPTKAE